MGLIPLVLAWSLLGWGHHQVPRLEMHVIRWVPGVASPGTLAYRRLVIG